MPCLNEVRTLAACIAEARAGLESLGVPFEIIVADNGSTDGSRDIAVAAGARLVPVAQKGYGHALRAGLDAAHGRFLLVGDADLSYDFSHAGRIVEKLREGYDLVMGNRFLGGIQPGAMPWKNRYLGNPVLSLIGRVFFGGAVRDFHCGLRGFTAAAYRRMDLRTTGMEFASEMVIKARLHGLHVTEVPTVLRPDGRGRPPHLRPWRDGWRHLRFMLLFSPRWLFLYPGLALMLLGLGVGAALLPGPFRVGGVEFDINTLLFAAIAVLIGFQSTTFALLSKVFAMQAGLRPVEPWWNAHRDRAWLETGSLVGLALILAGLGIALCGVWYWGQQNFGDLAPREIMRWLIPGALSLAVGCQLILASFFLGVLGLKLESAPPAPSAV